MSIFFRENAVGAEGLPIDYSCFGMFGKVTNVVEVSVRICGLLVNRCL